MSKDRDVLHGRESAFKHLRRMRSLGAGLIVLCTGWLLAAAPAQAQKIPVIPCAHTGKPAFGQELEQPRVIRPVNGVVDSSLVVRKATRSRATSTLLRSTTGARGHRCPGTGVWLRSRLIMV